MSLKEELSNNRRAALAEKANFGAQADEEMRKIIHDYVYPILRHINSVKPLEKTLSLRCDSEHSYIAFSSKLSGIPGDLQRCRCQLPLNWLFDSATRVAPELELKATNFNNGKYVIFEMTLDD